MWPYTLRRLLATVPTVLAVVTVCYLLLHAVPGGPFSPNPKVSAAVLANLQAKYHLDLPLWQQYLLYLRGLAGGDLGVSFRYADWSVNELVVRALPVSLAVGGTAMGVSLAVGVALGTFAALQHNRPLDHAVMLLANAGGVVPSFVIGPVLVLAFAITLHWLPAGGWDGFSPRHMVLPVAMLAILNIATVARVMRASLLEVLGAPFIRTAHAKGLPLRRVVWRHALRPALLPVVALTGPLAIGSITSAVVTETWFSLPGLGRLVVNGAVDRDYTLVLGLVVLVTVMAVLLNLLTDLACAWLDPRARL